jgi:uncharacterized protein (TIGR03437 family)
VPAQISFAGINGLPGVYQFNVTVPANLPDGDAPVVANFNNFGTQAGVMLSVHQ